MYCTHLKIDSYWLMVQLWPCIWSFRMLEKLCLPTHGCSDPEMCRHRHPRKRSWHHHLASGSASPWHTLTHIRTYPTKNQSLRMLTVNKAQTTRRWPYNFLFRFLVSPFSQAANLAPLQVLSHQPASLPCLLLMPQRTCHFKTCGIFKVNSPIPTFGVDGPPFAALGVEQQLPRPGLGLENWMNIGMKPYETIWNPLFKPKLGISNWYSFRIHLKLFFLPNLSQYIPIYPKMISTCWPLKRKRTSMETDIMKDHESELPRSNLSFQRVQEYLGTSRLPPCSQRRLCFRAAATHKPAARGRLPAPQHQRWNKLQDGKWYAKLVNNWIYLY